MRTIMCEVLRKTHSDDSGSSYVTSLSVEVSGKIYSTTEPKRFHSEPTEEQRADSLNRAKRRVMEWIGHELFGELK
jgi:hypothetical protein